ncbi:NAD-dependent dehydratase [archaeon CG10_big_fil_rev_8_21_14_0_10_43_11]|nr:MAG: NAD-dependent dehydratase [archaeon CG10_big_fil_rev_8_21_14_0_10_43_11]
MNCKNGNKTCWNCPAAVFKGNVDFRACGQSKEDIKSKQGDKGQIMIECSRRPELGYFEPNLTFEQCNQWEESEYGYKLKDMRVMILGMDGYLGWSLALKLARLGYKVSGFDNYWRRRCVAEKNSHSITPILPMQERLQAAKEVFDVDIAFAEIDIRERDKLKNFLKEHKPEVIIHYAECPSAPYSMVNAEHAINVQDNNVLGTLGLLFLIKELVPESTLIKLGTMGEYGAPLTGRPIFEGLFPADATIEWKGQTWSLGGEMTPRDPVSFYHVSKVQDTFNVYEACKYWWLRSYDIMQGVIYGVHTNEISKDKRLLTRFDADEWFGTVINRFVAQAILGIPLTIYGSGEQIRGFIALEDAMQCMVRLINSPPEPGQYDVVNQVSGLYKVRELADTVAKVGKEFGYTVRIQRIENPRVEADNHPLEVVSTKLPNTFGFKTQTTLEQEVRHMFEILTQPESLERLEAMKHAIIPETRWDGTKKKSETLELYNNTVNTKTSRFEPKLHET